MATPRIVPGWNPLTHPASSDDEVFELLSAAVFQARFSPEVVRQRWPAICQTFFGFDLARIAAWPDERVAVLMANPRIIRNEKKLRAVLRNARDLQQRVLQHGGTLAYLHSLGDDEDASVRAIDTWAHYIGAPSIRWFVRALRARANGLPGCLMAQRFTQIKSA